MPQCAICVEDMKEPVYLDCGHHVCLSCVIHLIQKRIRKCPFCRTPIRYIVTRDSKLKACYD